MLWRREGCPSLLGIESQFPSFPVHSIVTIVTELLWPYCQKCRYCDPEHIRTLRTLRVMNLSLFKTEFCVNGMNCYVIKKLY